MTLNLDGWIGAMVMCVCACVRVCVAVVILQGRKKNGKKASGVRSVGRECGGEREKSSSMDVGVQRETTVHSWIDTFCGPFVERD